MKIILALILSLSGCATVDLRSEDVASSRTVHIGLVLIETETKNADPRLVEHSTLGAWIGFDGLGGGYKKKRDILVPRECRIVFLVDNDEQLNASIDLVSSTLDTSQGDICVLG